MTPLSGRRVRADRRVHRHTYATCGAPSAGECLDWHWHCCWRHNPPSWLVCSNSWLPRSAGWWRAVMICFVVGLPTWRGDVGLLVYCCFRVLWFWPRTFKRIIFSQVNTKEELKTIEDKGHAYYTSSNIIWRNAGFFVIKSSQSLCIWIFTIAK